MCAKLLIAVLIALSGVVYGQDIFTAARSGNLDVIEQLHKIDPDTINATNASGFQPLMIACYRGQTEAAKLLVDLGADVNAVSPEGTALMAAVYQSNYELTRFLLFYPVSCNVQGPDGNTPLMYAVLSQKKDIVKLLLEKSDLSLTNKDGQTALSLAQALGDQEIVKLIERKAAKK